MFCSFRLVGNIQVPKFSRVPKVLQLERDSKENVCRKGENSPPHTTNAVLTWPVCYTNIYPISNSVFAAGYVNSMQCQEPSMLFLLPACDLGSRCSLGIPSFPRMDTHQISPFIPTLCSVPLHFMAVVQRIPCKRQQPSRWQSWARHQHHFECIQWTWSSRIPCLDLALHLKRWVRAMKCFYATKAHVSPPPPHL